MRVLPCDLGSLAAVEAFAKAVAESAREIARRELRVWKGAGTEDTVILAVHVLAVNRCLPSLDSVQKCIQSVWRHKVPYMFYTVSYPCSPCR